MSELIDDLILAMKKKLKSYWKRISILILKMMMVIQH